jgi:RNA polymerase sigma-70 factor (ECF subfamily)
MPKDVDYRELVERSQQGDDESLNRLSEAVRERLYTYVFRLTMRDEVAQDVVQESMLEMFRFLDKLERSDRFWPWVRRIALNKIRHHYNREKARGMLSMGDREVEAESDGADGFTSLVTQELREIVTHTMGDLRTRYREVLVMRCYEEMEYSEIAEEFNCSEFSARVLFYRAKKSLAKQLSRRGLGKGALLTALVLFGKITAPSEAAASQISVTAAATKVGAAATLAGIAGSKAVILSLAAASVVTVGTIVVDPGRAVDPGPGATMATTRNVQECWHYFPEGQSGPVMMRQMMPDSFGPQAYCLWLENNVGSFYYDRNSSTVYHDNHRSWADDLTVRRLPTDSARMTEFLARMEGTKSRLRRVSDIGRGTLVVTTHEGGSFSVYHPSLLDEEYFQYSWPRDVRVVDKRDEIHKQGWGYAVVTGELAGEKISGLVRIPFVYDRMHEHRPSLKMQIGDRFVVWDSPTDAGVHDLVQDVRTVFAPGTFLTGLGRQWMGLHTIDSVRRDAAAQEIPFESKYVWGTGDKQAMVKLNFAGGEMVYTIDMYRDVIDELKVNFGDCQGQIDFKYVAETGGVEDEIITGGGASMKTRDLDSFLWLIQLCNEAVVR